MDMKSDRGQRARMACALAAVAALALVAGCNRDKVELTQCEGGVAEIARTADVAPPSC